MISSLDPVGPGLRHDPIYLEGRGPVIAAEQARALGLRNGQVVQAVVTDDLRLQIQWPGGQRGTPGALQAFPMPTGWTWGAGTQLDLAAMLLPGGHLMLRALNRPGAAGASGSAAGAGSAYAAGSAGGTAGTGSAYGAGAGARTGAAGAMGASAGLGPGAASAAAAGGGASAATATAAGAGATGVATGAAGAAAAPPGSPGLGAQALNPEAAWTPDDPAQSPAPRYTLGQAFAAAQAQAAGASVGGEWARLMQHAPAWPSLLRLLHTLTGAGEAEGPMGADDGSAADEGTGAGAASEPGLRLPLPRMAGLSAEGLRQAMLRTGLGTEAALLAGSTGWVQDDLKVALRRLLRAAGGVAAGTERALSDAVDDLERSQLDSLTAQMQGQVLLSMAIPFGDAGPVALRLFRQAVTPDQGEPPFVVDIHSRHSGLGALWLRTAVSQGRLSMTMWAERADVAERARERARDLRWSLTCSGLRLDSLEILDGPRPPGDDPFAAPVPAPAGGRPPSP